LESHRFVVNVEVAVVRADRYLAIVRGAAEDYGAGWLGFPGGKVDPGPATPDILEHTARREVLEEVGLVLDSPIAYVESHTFTIGEEVVLDVVMLARAPVGAPVAVSPDEVAGLEWLTYDAFRNDPRTQAWTRDSLDLAERKRQDLGW
jgi:8-oxo-dGTP pyrophosphatase MutT (NUDIX family)